VLAYHNIVPDDAHPTGDRSLHLPRKQFAQQLDVLVHSCDVIPLTAVLAEPLPDARPRVAITFDDAYRGALLLGAAELRARRLPATMFAAPGLLGTSGFWWDALAGPGGLPDEVREHALGELRGDGDVVRAWAVDSGRTMRDMPASERPGTESELMAWANDDSLTVGAHTWRHANLSRLTASDIEEEVVRPLTWLRDRMPAAVVPWLTYPYGLATVAVASAAKTAGYEAALAVSGGWIGRPRGDPYWLPRLNIPAGLTLHGLRLRLAGIIGSPVAPRPHTLLPG